MRLEKTVFCLITVSLLSVFPDLARDSWGSESPPLLQVRYVESSPAIDGDPGDAAWKDADSAGVFTRLDDPKATSKITTVRALYDNRALYILFICRGKPTSEIRAEAIRRESPVWETDDAVEFFFMPGDQDTLYVQLATNAIGTEYDIQSSGRDYYKDFTWSTGPGWADDSWVMEMEIPLQPIAPAVKAGEVWRANFARHFWSERDSVITLTWSAMVEGLHESGNFGRIGFDRDVTFAATPGGLELGAEESRSIENLRRLKGDAVYRPIRDYLDIVLTHRALNRSFENLRSTVLDFIRDYPDSSDALDMALRSLHPSATSHRVSPEDVEALLREYESILHPDRYGRDLLELGRGLFYNEIQQGEQWFSIYDRLTTSDPRITATAAYLLVTRSQFRPPVSGETLSRIREAVSTYTDLAIRGSTPVHMSKGVSWLTATPNRDGVYDKYYSMMKRIQKIAPEEISSLARSLSADTGLPGEAHLVLQKIEFERYYDRAGPDFDLRKADSLIVVINEKDREYAQLRLNTLLREKILQLDEVYREMGPESLPDAVRKAVELRKQFDGFHPIDMVFALCYETVDSLDTALEYLESYRNSLGTHWQASGPVARYLDEVRFRRDHRGSPDFFKVPEDNFRLVYRVQGYRSPSNILDISSDGRAVLYSDVPDSLDPRVHIGVTVPAVTDSPAVSFRISADEVDSIRALLVRHGFLGFKLKNTEKCYRCGNREITLFTPWNMRTIHLEGENPSSPPFQMEQAVASILNRYIQPVFHLQTDWRELTDYYAKWSDFHSPSRSPNKRLDALIALFKSEPVRSAWQDEDWYIEPLLSLGAATGRVGEVEAAIGVRYFDSVFKWGSYAKERLPEPDAEEIIRSNDYLRRAAASSDDEKTREWFGFLTAFSRGYTGDLEELNRMAESLVDRENRGNALSLLLWLACASGEFEQARSIHTALTGSKAGRETKSDATIRMMLYSKDNNRNEEALGYLRQIESKYRGFLREHRQLPIKEIDDYSVADYQLDLAYLTCLSGDFAGAARLVGSMDESSIPPDRRNEYEDVDRLVRYREIPSTFVPYELPDYLRVFSALNHSGLYDHGTRWGIWLMDHVDDAKTRSQITSMLITSFQKREAWDDLQVATAGKLLDDYRADPGWKSVELTARILDTVIEHGDEDDVTTFWREQIQPYPIQTTRIKSLDRLVNYFSDGNDIPELQQVLMKIRREISGVDNASPISELVKTKYALDLADIYVTHLNEPGRGVSLVDSLAGRLPEIDAGAYPYVFAAIADWRSRRVGWEALVEFVRPMADSLIRAEREVPWNIYRPHLIPDTPIDSPLLALRCMIQQGGLRRLDYDFLELLDLDPETADQEIRNLKISPRRLNLDCDQASLLNWREESFEAILDLYSRQIR